MTEKPDGQAFEAVFSNDTAELSEIREFVREKAQGLGFSEEELYQIQLAVDEACANVMEHAYPPGMANPGLHLAVQVEYDRFTIVIADRGLTFDPNLIAPPDLAEYLAEYRVGGLGIYLMRTLMDQVDYNIQPGVKNEVRLTKYLATE
jgi:serine/threonine-protein kinase RsbW